MSNEFPIFMTLNSKHRNSRVLLSIHDILAVALADDGSGSTVWMKHGSSNGVSVDVKETPDVVGREIDKLLLKEHRRQRELKLLGKG